ncbi:hypothetical protein [Streptomyces sp. NPDC093149]
MIATPAPGAASRSAMVSTAGPSIQWQKRQQVIKSGPPSSPGSGVRDS